MVVDNITAIHKWLYGLIFLVFSLAMHAAYALDNPDAPDLVGEFEAREQVLLKAVNNPDNGARANLIAYDDYLAFLDAELNNAYKLVQSKLSKDRQQELKKSQQNWILFRDAEFAWIKNNWTNQDFGSSAGLSRGSYRCSIVRDRVSQLLNYAKNY